MPKPAGMDHDDISVRVGKVVHYLEAQARVLCNPFSDNPLLTKAFGLAHRHHFGQIRKGDLPYIIHPIEVARMLQEEGCADEVVAAGLLHDVLEDTGCSVEEMNKTMGARITKIVSEVTDKDKTLSWHERKVSYLKGLACASNDALFVACSDKTHNIESLLDGCRNSGEAFSRLFLVDLSDKVENYRQIYDLIASKIPAGKPLSRYKNCLDELLSFKR